MADGKVIVVQDNTKAVASATGKAIAAALEEIGLVAEGYAKKACPVRTGRLRNSITHVRVQKEKAVYIGTDVEYGKYVELGTRKQRAKPYLRPAAANHIDAYKSIVRKHFGG